MHIIDLAGAWQLTGGTLTAPVPACVPGDTHSALLAAGRIPDPYWGANELQVQEVGRQDWTFARTVEVPPALLGRAAVWLVCDCLDTVAEVAVNGRVVGTGASMFVRHRFPVKEHLVAGANRIEVRFRSAERAACEEAARHAQPYPFNPVPVQSPHRNLVRKAQCHGGWDWGACLMVAGIHGRIALEGADLGHLEHVWCDQEHRPGACTVTVVGEFHALAAGRAEMEVDLGGVRVRREVALAPGANRLEAAVELPQPRLWWPNGLGESHLYELTVRVGDAEQRRRIGLRRLEVVSEDDQAGRSLVFRVNGVPVFCKGANWIPCDALPQRQTRAAIDDLLASAAAAHMNMIRVWGGGQYESDDFYDLCDAKGLLVWQDFMFSCAMYPATPDFLDLVRREAEHQVKRLRHHACLALWCGNNENLGAISWFEESRRNRDRYLVDYDRLNEGVLGAAVRAHDPGRTFWPSSPCGGPGDYSDCWHADGRGDMHYWKVWHEGASFDAFLQIRPRFCSEFGYQSFPSLDTIRSYAPPSQLNVTSPVMEHHQRNVGGNSRIIEMFSRYFRMPEGFANFVYLSQVQQAVAIRTAVEHWRSLRPHCMGTLYWQLNDNWPVCSWSSLDYGGKWKLLHHAARRFYAPSLLTARSAGGRVEVWLCDDRLEAREVGITVAVHALGDGAVRWERRITVATPGAHAQRVLDLALAEIAPRPEECLMTMTLDDGGESSVNEHVFAAWKRLELPEPGLRTDVREADGGFSVEVSSARPALFVALDVEGVRGEFDDNLLTILPGRPRRLRFRPRQDLPLPALRQALVVRHLRGSYA
ncbi:MAG: glycoside hydrolase family 2 protein [Planctomycetes bacterium]|nr:glycoside hydrolase family 2 protein [Planctomycetota bacterium]